MKTLKQKFAEIIIKVKLDENKTPIIKDLDKEYIQKVREWLQQKETDDFGGEISATEFKKELLEDLEK